MMTNVSRSSDGESKAFQESRSIEPSKFISALSPWLPVQSMYKYIVIIPADILRSGNSEFSILALCSREQTMQLLGLCDGK